VKAQVSTGGGYVTAIGYAIFNNKLEELLESFPVGLEEGEKLSEVKAEVFPSGAYLTAIGYEIEKGKVVFALELAKDQKLSEVKAKVFPNGDYLTATGYAISDNKLDKLLELFPTRLEAAERLSEMKAMVFQDEKYLNLLQYSIEKLKIDSVKLLIERDPSSVNSETVINGKSALKYATSLYQDNRDANSKASLISIIKILLENGANFRIIELYCPQPIKTEIDKIKDLHQFFCNNLQNKITKILQENLYEFDLELDLEQLNLDLIKELSKLEPFGTANSRPKFLLRNVYKIRTNFVGKKQEHLSCIFGAKSLVGFNNQIQAILFRAGTSK
jgi:hypothetical protein